jgi:hypothetical protein
LFNKRVKSSEYQLTVTPSTADNCLALSDSSIHVFETNTTGTLSWINFWIAGLATAMKFGPLVITPSISKKQAKLGYWKKWRMNVWIAK